MPAGTTMGRPKKDAKRLPGPRTIGVRASGEWADWVDQFAEHCRTDVAKLIDEALAAHAKVREFNKVPPKRVP
jgi:hypothetical protein